MEAYRRIHATLGERVVMPPDAPVRERPARPRQSPRRRTAPPAGYLTLGSTRFPSSGRPRPAGPVLTATAVIAVLALIALAVGRLVVGSPSAPARASSTDRTRAAGTGGTGATGAGATGAGAAGGTRTTRTTVRHRAVHTARAGGATRTTTAPPSVLVPRSSTAGGADYTVTTASFSVQVNTTGSCWLEVGPSAGGPFSFVGTVPAGQQKVFAAASRLWIRLGAPANVTVTVDGTPLQLHAPGSAPYNLTISSIGT